MQIKLEEYIKSGKHLTGFIPFARIAKELIQLPFLHQLAFFCSCCDRILPTYMLVNGEEGWGDISILESVSNELWKIAGGKIVSEDEIAALNNKVNEIFIEDEEWNKNNPHDYIRDCLCDYWGEVPPRYIKLILDYIVTHKIETYLKIFSDTIYSMYEYYGMHLPNVDADWEKRSREEQKSIILKSALLQREISKELADLEFLKNTPHLTSEILSTFRDNARPDGLSILGSLEHIRSDLEY